MPRPVRIEFADAIYHVTSRGNGRADIFCSEADRLRFLEQLHYSVEGFEVVLYAYVLMSNHYHLLVRTPGANLSRFMQQLNTSYALYARYKHRKPGHQLQGRFKAKLVQDEEYLQRVVRYVHLNPIKTRACEKLPKKERVAALEEYRWSSYPGYVLKRKAQEFVAYTLLKTYGRSWVEARRRYRAYVHAHVMESDEPLQRQLQAHEYAIGDETFLRDVEVKLEKRKKGDGRDRDILLPRQTVSLDRIDAAVCRRFGAKAAQLKAHGRTAGVAKAVAVELAWRLGGLSQRELGRHYGGITSTAVGKIRKRLRSAATTDLCEALAITDELEQPLRHQSAYS